MLLFFCHVVVPVKVFVFVFFNSHVQFRSSVLSFSLFSCHPLHFLYFFLALLSDHLHLTCLSTSLRRSFSLYAFVLAVWGGGAAPAGVEVSRVLFTNEGKMKREMEQIRVVSAVTWALYQPIVVRREPSHKAKLSI